MSLDRTAVHRGSGKIRFEGKVIGDATRVAFTLQKLGLEGKGDANHTCYGTASGRITDTAVVDILNNPHPTPSELELTLEGGENITLVGVEFIDDIPADGSLDEVEFDGTLKD